MAQEPDLLISAGFSDSQLVKEANRIVALYAKKGQEAEKAFRDAQGKVTDNQAVKAHTRELDRLAKAYDPAYRAAKKYEDEVKRLDRALDIGAITQKQYIEQTNAAAGAMKRAANGVREFGRHAQGGAGGVQNLSSQLQDVFVQFGAGTPILQTLGQQLPQILSGFGAFGAVAGLAAAGIFPLANALLKMGSDADNTEDSLKKLTESTDSYVAAAERAASPISDLRSEWGDLADEIQRVSGVQAAFLGVLANRNLEGTANLISQSFGGLSSAPRGDALSLAGSELEETLRNIRKLFGDNEVAASKFISGIQSLDEAAEKGPEAVVAAVEDIQTALTDFYSAGGELSPELEKIFSDTTVLAEQAAKNVAASATDQEKSIQRLSEKYQETTDTLKTLMADREEAQRVLDEAVKSDSQEQVSAMEAVMEAQDRQIAKVKEQALENDAAYQRMGESVRKAVSRFAEDVLEIPTAANKGILDLIGQAEGTDKGRGYNETLGYGAYTGGEVNLTNMTLREVLTLQKEILDHPNNPYNSSAVGRYQIVSKTLRGLIDELDLSLDEKFTPKLQDRLATQLVRRRAGQGVDGLRNEWEGLRNVSPALIQRALGQQVIPVNDEAIEKSLKDQVAERERLAEQVKKYGEQLASNLLTTQQQVELERQRNEQIAAIQEMNLTPEQEADAIAAVNAEMEKQATILKLVEESKRRNVDLDDRMAGSALTYRDAIAALGETERQRILNQYEFAKAQEEASDAQEFFRQQNQQLKSGLIDSIVEAENFADVLGNVAKQFAKAALEAAIFGSGPLSGGGGGGGLGGIFGAIGGLFRRGFSAGGYTGPGGTYQPAGVVHAGEYVMDAATVRRAGGPGAFDAIRRNLKGYADGGYVSPNIQMPSLNAISPASQAQSGDMNINVNVTGANGDQHIIDLVQQGVSQGINAYDNQMPKRVQNINKNPRRMGR